MKIALIIIGVLLLAGLLVVTGVQLVTMGLIGEMLARTYHESQAKLTYTIRRVLNRPGPST